MSNDTINLRSRASFSIQIFRKLHWVPFNVLGKSRYSNDDLKEVLVERNVQYIKAMKLNLYEAIQLFQMVFEFQEYQDILLKTVNNRTWQFHKSGCDAVKSNRGCCATAASWIRCVTEPMYQEQGYIHILRPNGSGHYMNYIYSDGFYFFDMTAQIKKYAFFAPRETGLLKDYWAAKYPFGVCLFSPTIEDFVQYHNRLHIFRGHNLTYSNIGGNEYIPPVSIVYAKDKVKCFASSDYNLLKQGDVPLIISDCPQIG